MKRLTSIHLTSQIMQNDFANNSDRLLHFLNQHQLNGIETLLYGDYTTSPIHDSLIVGVHCWYWPTWIDFYYGKKDKLLSYFLTEQDIYDYYWLRSPSDMVTKYKQEFTFAKEKNVEYLVFHVGHVGFDELIRCQYSSDVKEILTACIEIINASFSGDGPTLLFENLWYSGLTFLETNWLDWFLSRIHYQNIGLLLDVSHLLNTNPALNTTIDGLYYIHNVLDNLGNLSNYIKGMHLNQSLNGSYLSKNHEKKYQEMLSKKTQLERFKIMTKHVELIDSHQPFCDLQIMEVIERINPNWLVYELAAENAKELSSRICEQNQFLT